MIILPLFFMSLAFFYVAATLCEAVILKKAFRILTHLGLQFKKSPISSRNKFTGIDHFDGAFGKRITQNNVVLLKIKERPFLRLLSF